MIPVTTTVSASTICPTRRTAVWAVKAGASIATAAASSIPSGSGCTDASGTTASSPQVPGRETPTPPPRITTLVPTGNRSELSTTPEPSDPGVNGGCNCCCASLPASTVRSSWVTEAYRISTSVSPAPTGSSTSSAFSCSPGP